MIKTDYDVLTRNGKEKFFVVPVEAYQALLEKLEDQADYRALIKARKANAGKATYSLDQINRELEPARTATKRSGRNSKRQNQPR